MSLFRSELIKIRTVRTGYGLTLGAGIVVAVSTLSTIASAGAQSVQGALHDQQFFLLASVNIPIFGFVLGARAFTDEFRHGTIVPTLVAVSRRGRLLAAKAAVTGIAGLVLAGVGSLLMVGLATAMVDAGGGSLTMRGADLAALAGLTTAGGLWAVLGLAVGALVRHQVAATVSGILWLLIVENLGAGLLDGAGKFLPGQAAHGLSQATVAGDVLAVPISATVLIAYAGAALMASHVALNQRDI